MAKKSKSISLSVRLNKKQIEAVKKVVKASKRLDKALKELDNALGCQLKQGKETLAIY